MHFEILEDSKSFEESAKKVPILEEQLNRANDQLVLHGELQLKYQQRLTELETKHCEPAVELERKHCKKGLIVVFRMFRMFRMRCSGYCSLYVRIHFVYFILDRMRKKTWRGEGVDRGVGEDDILKKFGCISFTLQINHL